MRSIRSAGWGPSSTASRMVCLLVALGALLVLGDSARRVILQRSPASLARRARNLTGGEVSAQRTSYERELLAWQTHSVEGNESSMGTLAGKEWQHVTVVIMNWKRKENTELIAHIMAEYSIVSEVLVLLARDDTRFTSDHPKVRIVDGIEMNKKLGLNMRFWGCTLASNEMVLLHDDDLLTTEVALFTLLAMKRGQPDRLYGVYGRPIKRATLEYSYTYCQTGECDIILTRSMLADRRLCREYFKYAHLVEPFVKEHSVPYWNGEDIFMSLISGMVTGRRPFVVSSLPIIPLDEGWVGISRGSGHGKYRTDFTQLALKQLNITLPPIGVTQSFWRVQGRS